MQNQFAENFKNGRIIGETKIVNDIAEVEIAIGSSSNNLNKTQPRQIIKMFTF